VEGGKWKVVDRGGKWKVVSGRWYVEGGKWKVISGGDMICGRW